MGINCNVVGHETYTALVYNVNEKPI